MTDELRSPDEPKFATTGWYPARLGAINRFMDLAGQSNDNLVIVPGQFVATANVTSTLGTQRLYSQLELEVQYAADSADDFTPPTIYQTKAEQLGGQITFYVHATDDSGSISRVVILYRALDEFTWRKVEPTWISASQRATVTVGAAVKVHEYAVQVLDPSGNVSELRDYGNYYQIPLTYLLNVSKTVTPTQVYTNGILTYTIVVSNPDSATANVVTVTDILTAGLHLQSCAATGGVVCQSAGNRITTTFASIASARAWSTRPWSIRPA